MVDSTASAPARAAATASSTVAISAQTGTFKFERIH
jgi:hypothetical protein